MENNSELRSKSDRLTNKAEDAIHSVRGKAEDMASSARSEINELGSAIKKSGKAALNEINSVVDQTYRRAVETGKEGVDALATEVRRYPLGALAAAFGIGAVLGLLACSRSR